MSDQLNLRVVGSGEPTLVFVHGFACALDDWHAQVAELSADSRCLALDLPGHGGSALPETPSIAAMGAAVNAARKQAGGRCDILIGHSMGCRVVLEAYLQSPAQVAGLVLVDGSALGGDPETAVSRAKASIDAEGMAPLLRRMFAEMFAEGSDPAQRDRLIARALGLDARFAEALFLDLIRWDATRARDALQRIAVPSLLLQSTYLNVELRRMSLQPGMTTPWMDAVASLVAGSRASIVTGCGHFPMLEAAPAVSREITEFARSVA